MIRDHIDDFEISEAVLAKHQNEKRTIDMLGVGLGFLYKQVRQAEINARDQGMSNSAGVSLGRHGYQGPHESLLVCAFHWYAVSCCNMLGLIAFLRRKEHPDAEVPNKYVERVARDMKVFRDKVAAHFARATGRDPKVAEKMVSTMSAFSLAGGRLHLPPMVVHQRSGENVSDSREIRPWSLTKQHEDLCERFGVTFGPRPSQDVT